MFRKSREPFPEKSSKPSPPTPSFLEWLDQEAESFLRWLLLLGLLQPIILVLGVWKLLELIGVL